MVVKQHSWGEVIISLFQIMCLSFLTATERKWLKWSTETKPGDICRAKLQSNRHQQQINTQLCGCPSCYPTNSVTALIGKSVRFHGPAHSKLTWGRSTLSWTITCCWLPWRRVIKPLIGPSTPANNWLQRIYHQKQQTYQYLACHHVNTQYYRYYQLQTLSPLN